MAAAPLLIPPPALGFPKVAEILKNQTTPRPDLYILKGTAQYQMKQYENAIESVTGAITAAESRNADRVTQLQKNIR